MGAIQRGTSWATIPKTLNRARTVHAPCAHRARTVRQRPPSAEDCSVGPSPCSGHNLGDGSQGPQHDSLAESTICFVLYSGAIAQTVALYNIGSCSTSL